METRNALLKGRKGAQSQEVPCRELNELKGTAGCPVNVIASEAKQSCRIVKQQVRDCFVAIAPRNDKKKQILGHPAVHFNTYFRFTLRY